jgi:hypothetical protein
VSGELVDNDALLVRRLGEYGVERRQDWHPEVFQEAKDVRALLAAMFTKEFCHLGEAFLGSQV